MSNLRDSLQEMMEVSATTALAGGETQEGRQALIRMTLLFALMDRLDAHAGQWDDCGLLPEILPLGTDRPELEIVQLAN